MYKRKNNNWLKHADFLVLDLLCLLISFAVAYVIRHGLANPFATPLYRSTVIAWMVLDSIVLFGLNTLKNVLKRGYLRELFVTVKQGIVLMLLFSLYLFMTQGGQPFSRIVLFLCRYLCGLVIFDKMSSKIIFEEKTKVYGTSRRF